jgi:hypothetical protein
MSDRLLRQPCRTRGKKRGGFVGGGAGARPSIRSAWRPTALTSFGPGRDETSTLARLRETMRGTEVAEETDREVENRPDLAESCGVARRRGGNHTTVEPEGQIHGDPEGTPI